jgi:SAM-dependent methyltransferase
LEAGYNPVGITFGRDNIEIANKKYFIKLHEMDMHNLLFPENYFDGVFSIQTFEHAFSPWLHILEMRRVLRAWGRVFIDVPDPDDQVMLETIWHISVLYPNQIKALFEKAGFREVKDLTVKHRLAFCFEKLPDAHEEFKLWGYVKHIMEALRKVD